MLKQREICILLFCFFYIKQNLLIQLTSAIKELEASTAALECLYSDSTRASQSSLNSSSGYGTMNSTAAVSEDTIASCVEQPVNANLNELNVQMQGQGGDSDTDKAPKTVTRDPPFEPNAANPKYDGMDLIEAISDLYNYIAARHGDFTPGNREYKENLLLELAATIKELEASTALECSYSDSTRASQLSLNSSSGYGTMNSTPAVSVDTLASCGEQPVYANLKELNVQVQGQGGDSDTDKTPKTVTRDPPFEPNAANPEFDGMDLTEAISDLENYIAALYGDFTPGDRTSKARDMLSFEISAQFTENFLLQIYIVDKKWMALLV
ncbi:uncharacterized protein LOC128546638 isoform X2 [Mercenaria mercenaria]|uniref:uncharacterized protein LOC128546638 isoform X2 n=1 Tax=Mercenaria mercenaria TaxID=6596 RepID=UPI00234F16D8|nr:uncharacterized protein LOC128546638 isoform X2 [Mercenaria mercenaria]